MSPFYFFQVFSSKFLSKYFPTSPLPSSSSCAWVLLQEFFLFWHFSVCIGKIQFSLIPKAHFLKWKKAKIKKIIKDLLHNLKIEHKNNKFWSGGLIKVSSDILRRPHKFEKTPYFVLTLVSIFFKVGDFSNFVAFSQYLNFTSHQATFE